MKKIFLLFTILLYGIVSFAQENAPDYTPNILPRSPQAEQYMRYGEIPVSLSTGVPEISIPIYTIQAGGLSIPISISYHASGNKVEDVASPVGLGWVLNAGGMISQSVSTRFAPDYKEEQYEFASLAEAKERLKQDKDIAMQSPAWNINSHYWTSLLQGDNFKKTISDRFTYNFNGNYGVFRKDIKSKEYKTIPERKLKINHTDKEIIITDTDGNIWTFKQFETVYSHLSGDSGYEYHVTNIKNPVTSFEINFLYDKGTRYFIENKKKKFTYHFEPQWSFNDASLGGRCVYNVSIDGSFKYSEDFLKDQSQLITPILLRKIEWQNSAIEFSYVKDRKDISNGERLDKIIIKSGNEKFETKLYSTNYNFGKYNDRLLLDGIKVKNDYYSFEYNQDIKISDYSNKCNTDLWGYYNGKNSDNWYPIELKFKYPNIIEQQYSSSREPNPKCTQFGIIKNIKYPTGGRTEFIFENNQGKDVYDLWMSSKISESSKKYFGGLRVKEIKNYDNNNLLEIKTYEYDGKPNVTIGLHHFFEKKVFLQKINYPSSTCLYYGATGYLIAENLSKDSYQHVYSNYMYSSYSSGIAPITNPWGQAHCYSKVVEYTGDININNGKTEYEFTGPSFGYKINLDQYEFGSTSYQLKSKKIFKKETGLYKLIHETSNTYEQIKQDFFTTGITVKDNDQILLFNIDDLGRENEYIYLNDIKEFYFNGFDLNEITAFSNHALLKSTEETSYTDKGIIKSTISYDYDPQLRVLSPIKTQTTNSQGQTIIGTTTYPFNYSGGIYSTMIDRNMLNYPVEQITQTGATETTRVKTEYGLWNNLVLPVQIFSSVNGGTLTKEISYDKYNSKGNLLQYAMRDGVPVSFVWGYNYQYPVAKIANATYDRAKIALGQASNTDDLPYLQILTGASLHAELNKLRSISGTLVETYEYKPLFGIIKATDPSGHATTYDYDSFGRLEQIKDHNGNILEKYKYNYIK